MEEKKEIRKPSFYAIIPASVRYNKSVCQGARLLYGEITALCNEKGYCWSSNKYFAELYGKSERMITEWISQLSKAGHIRSFVVGKDRKIYISDKGFVKTLFGKVEENLYPSQKKTSTDDRRKLLHNNTFNNTYNKERDLPEEFEEISKNWEQNPNKPLLLEERNKFLSYWLEKSPNGKKCRWEMEKVFDIKRRWGTWMRNVESRNKPKEFVKQPDSPRSGLSSMSEIIKNRI